MESSTASTEPRAFGTLLRRYRRGAGLTQEELAERAAISVRALGDLERGAHRVPHPDTVALLAAGLELAEPERATFAAAAQRLPRHLSLSAGKTGRAVSGPAAPAFVGRTRELEVLARHLGGGGPPLLLLAGEPGIGKTRLLQAVLPRATGLGLRVLLGEAASGEAGQAPYAPLLEALQRHIASQRPEVLRTQLDGCAWLVRLLPELAGGPIPPLPAWILPPEQEQRLMAASVQRFLANVAGPAGTLLVLDDLQWAGRDALDLLATLARSAAEAPLRIMGAYRDTEVQPSDPLGVVLADLVQAGLAARRPLAPLAPEEAAQLLDGLLAGMTTEGQAVRERVLRRAGGVPFFLVTWAQAARAEEGDADGGAAVPWDVAQDIRRRVAALSPAARDLLGVAALVGRAAAYPLLATVSALPDAEAVAALDAACGARLLVDAGANYAFAHDVVREVVEADLGAARRTVFHRRVAEALAAGPARAAAEVLAYHYKQGGLLDTAASYLEQAGDQARARAAHAAAAEYYREAVEGLATLGRTEDTVALRAKLGQVLLTLGRPDEALAVLEPAATAARAARDMDRLGALTALLAAAYRDASRGEEGLRRIEGVLAVLAPHGPSHGLAALRTAQAALLRFLGRYMEQLAAADRAVELARGLGDTLLLAQAQEQRRLALNHAGQNDQWLSATREMPRLAEAAGDPTTLSNALNDLAVVSMLNGEFDQSRAYNERSIAVAEQLGDPGLIGYRVGIRGFIAIYTGEWAQARVDIEREVAMHRALNAPPYSALCILGQLCLVEGAWDEASRHLEEATATAERFAYHEGFAFAQRLLAELDLLEGRPAPAQVRLVAQLESPTQDQHDYAFILPSLAWASLQLGDADAASTVAAAAVARARAEQNRLALADALRVDALVATARQQWTAAVSSLDNGLALTRQIRYPYGEGRLLRVYGLLHLQRNEPELARARLEAALALFRHLGARRDVDQVAQTLATLPGG